MLPVLSIVKYELIQIEKVYAEIEKVLPCQLSDDHGSEMAMHS
jgi:hypothetical protein